MSDAREIAERALAAAPPGCAMQATVSAERSVLLRFARSRPTQATAVDDMTVELTALREGHAATVSTNRVDADSFAACAREAVAAAEALARAPQPGSYPGFPGPAEARPHQGWDADTARADPGAGGREMARAFEVAAGAGVEAHGVWTCAEVRTAVASTSGQLAHDRVTDAFMKVTCIAPGGRSGYAAATSVGASELDGAALASDATARATGTLAARAGEPERLPPGDYPVVLEAHAVGELLGWLASLALNGLAWAEGRSTLSGRLGTKVAAPSINLADSPRHPRTLPRAFDAEGVPKAPLPLIQDGVAHRVVHDTSSAALAGAASSGHATAPGGSPDGPLPTNLVLSGGGAGSAEELCRPLERGVYVTRLWYTNAVRPKESLITGMTRDGTFLVRDGEIAAPLEDMRLTDSVLGLFGRVEDLGGRPVLTSEGEFYGRRFASGVVCPPLRAAALRFTA